MAYLQLSYLMEDEGMKRESANTLAIVLILTTMLGFSGCKRETNTSGNPEVGQATGAAANNEKMVPSPKSLNPDTTVVPSPTGYQPMVPTVPSGHRNLDRASYMEGCRQLCTTGKQAKDLGHDAPFCDTYCGCSYERMQTEIPIDDLRAYARGQTPPSSGQIDSIIKQCLTVTATQRQAEKAGKPSAAKIQNLGNPEASGQLNSTSAKQAPVR
jgi:hypothetical protein